MQDKLENNYSVYQHVTPDNMYYFGQTNNIKRRWSNNGAEYKGTALQPYIEKFGWDNIKHIVLFKDQTKENALWIEDFLITTAREDGVCINKQRSGLVSKEEDYNKNRCNQYYDKNKQQILEQHKQYYEENKQQILEQKQQYREQNKDKIKQYYEENKDKFKEYYEKNKQQIRKQQKQYYEENKQQRIKYQREYRQRKKKEQQFKELGYIPLF